MDSRNKEPDTGCWVDKRMGAVAPEASWEPAVQRGLARFRQQRAETGTPRRRWMWVTAGTAVACVSLMATPVTRAFAQRCVSACVSESGWLQSLLVSVTKPSASVAYI